MCSSRHGGREADFLRNFDACISIMYLFCEFYIYKLIQWGGIHKAN